MEELYGILIAYEMRFGQDNSQKKEENFKASKVDKKYKTKIQSKDYNDEEALLVKNLKRGIGKYKWKLPLKFLTVVGLVSFLPNSLIQNKKMMMSSLKIQRRTKGFLRIKTKRIPFIHA